MKRVMLCLAVVLWTAAAAQADVRVPGLFSDNLVLQRDQPLHLWGEADAGEPVTAKLGDSQAMGVADANGKWAIKLPPQKLNAKPQDLTISGKNSLTLKNVVIGDVWICSGQSNMEWTLGGCEAPQDISTADFPNVRRIKQDHRAIARPGSEITGRWDVCTPGSCPNFTAVGFYFARRVNQETGVPIGLIDSSWGGTAIEPWVPPVGFEMVPSLADRIGMIKQAEENYRNELGKRLDGFEQWVAATRKAMATPGAELPVMPPMPENPLTNAGFPTTLYNGMIHPFLPFTIKGALWYQGETNGGDGDEYADKMEALVGGWRKVWGQGEFPFYFVQLANLGATNDSPAGGDGWARVRSAQTKALRIPNSGMAVTIDVGEAGDIHPKNKFDVGERLARWALRNDYGKSDLVVSGPLLKSSKIEDGKIRLQFDHTGTGLIVGKKKGLQPTEAVKDGQLKRFAIAGEHKQWVWADAVIDGPSVVVSSPQVPRPVAVRYAFTMNPEGANLYNKEGLPASSFRTDEW